MSNANDKGEMSIPQVDNHSCGSGINVSQLLPLPAHTPWGNLSLKSMKIVQRVEHINRKIRHAYQSFNQMRSNQMMAYDVSALEIEEVIYWIRKTVDEFIQLMYVLERFEEEGSWPIKIEIDSIGALLYKPDSELYRMFDGHHEKLRQLNDVGNAYKHSFIGTDMNLIGRDEPLVFSLAVGKNDLSKETQFNAISLADFVQHFDELYQFIREKCLEKFQQTSNN